MPSAKERGGKEGNGGEAGASAAVENSAFMAARLRRSWHEKALPKQSRRSDEGRTGRLSGDFLPKLGLGRGGCFPKERPLLVSFECDSLSAEMGEKKKREKYSRRWVGRFLGTAKEK